MILQKLARKWWFYVILIAIYFMPPYASNGYDPKFTQEVVFEALKVSLLPYRWLAPFFHTATLLLLICMFIFKDRVTRIFYTYGGLNFLFIAFAQTIAFTEKYGLVILLGGTITFSIIALSWLSEAVVKKSAFEPKIHALRCWIIPLAVLAFWSPVDERGNPALHPIYLLTSYYGLAFCLTAPVLLAMLILCYSQASVVLRVTGVMGGALRLT